MPKFIEQADIKKMIWGMFLFVLFLVKVICLGAYQLHSTTIAEIKTDLKEGRLERKEIIKQVHQLDVTVARMKQ